MRVYVLFRSIQYEGSDLMGIFHNKDDAYTKLAEFEVEDPYSVFSLEEVEVQ